MPLPIGPRAPWNRRAAILIGVVATGAALIPASSAMAATSITSIVNATPSGSVVKLGSGTYSASNFTNSIGVNIAGKAGLSGTSASGTVVQLNQYSSTRAGVVPTAKGTSNPLYLMSAGGSPRLSNFTLQGTPQGHLYNGLKLSNTSNAVISNVKVAAIPGAGYNPPQETFAINDQRSTGSRYSNVTVDGAGVGAVGIGANSSSNISVSNSSFNNNKYSAGVAFWQTKNITLTNVSSKNNRTGLNFERCSGTITISSPTILNESNQDLYIGSDQASAKITITNPTYSGHLRIRVPAVYRGVANRQHKSDIRVLVNGVDRTSSVVTWI
jgi:hypothetical protein